MSVAYVSEVERGNRAAPNAERAAAWARAVRADEEAFIAAAAQDRESLELPIEEGIPHFRREAAFAFARAYDGLTKEQAKKVMKLLRGQE
jgi:transcriptional regulator with XRE-family HTH domain